MAIDRRMQDGLDRVKFYVDQETHVKCGWVSVRSSTNSVRPHSRGRGVGVQAEGGNSVVSPTPWCVRVCHDVRRHSFSCGHMRKALSRLDLVLFDDNSNSEPFIFL